MDESQGRRPWYLAERNMSGAVMRGTVARRLSPGGWEAPDRLPERKRMHQPIPEQGTWLKQVVAGFYNYHAVPTNGHALWSFRDEVTRRWQQTLGRRSQKGELNWSRMTSLDWQTPGSPNRASSTPGPTSGSPSSTRGKSRTSVSSMRATLGASGMRCASGCRSFRYRCIRKRPA
jgi:hypothetical protein